MERRREQRVGTALAVRFPRGEGTTRDVSESGLYFTTDVEVQPGEILHLTIDYAESPGGPLKLQCEARVLRVERRGADFGIAVSVGHMTFRRRAP